MQIGRKQQIIDIRSLWRSETDFSDWLITDEGLALIAEEIGIEIEEPVRESRPGNYPCDIAGRLRGQDDHIVVIENQFGKTDHDHLGKLLTYAAVHSAVTAVWIAESASDDHRKVIDWLNDNTPVNLSLYLAELRAYHIGDSPAAPELRVVSRPNIAVKTITGQSNAQESDSRIWHKNFWEDIFARMNQKPLPFPLPTQFNQEVYIHKQNKMYVCMRLIPSDKRIQCKVEIANEHKEAYFEQLKLQSTAIEAELGQALVWMPKLGQKSGYIYMEAMINPKDPANHEQVIAWFDANAVPFYNAFHGRIERLHVPD